MELSRPWQILRDVVAVFVTGLFMFPIFWWALTSIKPISAMFDKDRVVVVRFHADADQLCRHAAWPVALADGHREGFGMGVGGAGTYDSRQSILDSIVVSIGSTAVTMLVAVLAAYALSRMAFQGPRQPISIGCWASASCRPSPSSFHW